jgi:hypothetical protein
MTQCVAHSQGGAQCRRLSIPGTTVCRYHGGDAPQVLRKAKQRQAELMAVEIIRNYGGIPPVTDPISALSELAPETLALKYYLRGKVDALRAEEWWYKGAGQEQLRSEIVCTKGAWTDAPRCSPI